MVSLFCFSHLIGQLAEAHIVSWFELGRVQLDLLSQLDQAWRGSQTALQSHLLQCLKVVEKNVIGKLLVGVSTGLGGGGGAGRVFLSSVRTVDRLSCFR